MVFKNHIQTLKKKKCFSQLLRHQRNKLLTTSIKPDFVEILFLFTITEFNHHNFKTMFPSNLISSF